MINTSALKMAEKVVKNTNIFWDSGLLGAKTSK